MPDEQSRGRQTRDPERSRRRLGEPATTRRGAGQTGPPCGRFWRRWHWSNRDSPPPPAARVEWQQRATKSRSLFSLFWPTEAGHALRAGIDGDDIEFRRDAITESAWVHYTGGKALDIRTACLEVSGYPQESVPVQGSETGARIRVQLEAGDVHLRAFFSNNKGLMQAPYHVYVRRVG